MSPCLTRTLYTLFLLLLGLTIGWAQQKELIGVVTDEGNSPIDFAQVVLTEPNKTTVAFAFSDSTGRFRLVFDAGADSLLLIVSRLGFESRNFRVPNRSQEINVRLALSASSKLSEVIIRDTGPVTSEGDTVRYSAEAFLDGSERNVEDLLAKMPGFSVDMITGKISYQGREIKKILLDGDDLTGENYKALSKNLSAKWLEEVEVLKRFTGSRLLQGIKQSEDVAINLKLKEEAKAPLFGQVEAGGGIPKKYQGNAELLSYLKKVKLFAVLSANNTGEGLQNYDLETYSSTQLQVHGFGQATPLLATELGEPPMFNSDQFTFHEGQFVSNAVVIRPSAKSSLRSYTSFYHNQIAWAFTDSLFYPLPDETGFSLVQQRRQNQRPLDFFQDLKWEQQVSENKDLAARLQFHAKRQDLASQNLTPFRQVQENTESLQARFLASASLTHRFRPHWVSKTALNFTAEGTDEHLGLGNRSDLAADSLRQQLRQHTANVGVLNELYGVISKTWFLSATSGGIYTKADLEAERSVLDGPEAGALFGNTYRSFHGFTEWNIKKQFSKWAVSTGARARYMQIAYNGNGSGRVLLEPRAMVNWRVKWREVIDSELRLLYNLDHVFLQPGQLFLVPVLTSFRTTALFNADPFTPLRNQLTALSIKLEEKKYSYLTANIQTGYLQVQSPLVPNLSFSDDIVQIAQVQGGNATNIFSNQAVDRYFRKLRSSIKLSYNYQLGFTPLVVEGVANTNRSTQHAYKFTAGMGLLRKLPLSLAAQRVVQQNQWGETTTAFAYWDYVAKTTCKITPQLHTLIDYRAVSFDSDPRGMGTVLGATIRYALKSERATFNLWLNNLLNTDAIEIATLEPTQFSSTRYPLLGRFALLSVTIQL